MEKSDATCEEIRVLGDAISDSQPTATQTTN